jgi:hypothetical protein
MLNYLALAMIFMSVVAIFYLFIYIHELPYEAAKHRDHPQTDAIYVACWISLFTLHAIWPLVFIWALSHDPTKQSAEHSRLIALEGRLAALEASTAYKGATAHEGATKS